MTAEMKPQVLVADDDISVRMLIVEILETRGLTALAAYTGPEAVCLAEKHADSLSLAILDVVMPDQPCLTTLLQLREQIPSLPVLLISGYDRDQAQTVLEAGANAFLRKPFKVSRLFEMIATLAPALWRNAEPQCN